MSRCGPDARKKKKKRASSKRGVVSLAGKQGNGFMLLKRKIGWPQGSVRLHYLDGQSERGPGRKWNAAKRKNSTTTTEGKKGGEEERESSLHLPQTKKRGKEGSKPRNDGALWAKPSPS